MALALSVALQLDFQLHLSTASPQPGGSMPSGVGAQLCTEPGGPEKFGRNGVWGNSPGVGTGSMFLKSKHVPTIDEIT